MSNAQTIQDCLTPFSGELTVPTLKFIMGMFDWGESNTDTPEVRSLKTLIALEELHPGFHHLLAMYSLPEGDAAVETEVENFQKDTQDSEQSARTLRYLREQLRRALAGESPTMTGRVINKLWVTAPAPDQLQAFVDPNDL
jgi:hypothetical protein